MEEEVLAKPDVARAPSPLQQGRGGLATSCTRDFVFLLVCPSRSRHLSRSRQPRCSHRNPPLQSRRPCVRHFRRRFSLLSAEIRLRFITRAVDSRISFASTITLTYHSSPRSRPKQTKPSLQASTISTRWRRLRTFTPSTRVDDNPALVRQDTTLKGQKTARRRNHRRRGERPFPNG